MSIHQAACTSGYWVYSRPSLCLNFIMQFLTSLIVSVQAHGSVAGPHLGSKQSNEFCGNDEDVKLQSLPGPETCMKTL